MSEITSWSAVHTAGHIRARTISVREVVEAHLDRLEAVNPALNAVTEVADNALEQARQMDENRPTGDMPPLFGVPVTTKINADQIGYANSNGVPAFRDNICTEDAPVVANLKAAGAVIIGRTNTPEFSMRWCTSNPLHGVSHNPWNRTITPGGSSGAAAAAIVSGVGCIAHGNDLGGSLRYPAFCCGVTSIRPSMGRVPTFNLSTGGERPPIAHMMSVQGPIARSVGDLRLGLEAMARRAAQDPSWTSAPDSGRQREDGVRIGYCADPFGDGVDPAIDTAMGQAVAAAEEAGHEVVEYLPPEANLGARLWGDLLFTETEAVQGAAIMSHGSADMQRLVTRYFESYTRLDVTGFIAALGARARVSRLWAQMFDEIDLMLMPTSMIPPFANDRDFNDPGFVPALMKAQKPLHLINLLGLPSVALPTGLASGIPVGVQLVAPMHDDFFALDIADTLERQLGTLWEQLG